MADKVHPRMLTSPGALTHANQVAPLIDPRAFGMPRLTESPSAAPGTETDLVAQELADMGGKATTSALE